MTITNLLEVQTFSTEASTSSSQPTSSSSLNTSATSQLAEINSFIVPKVTSTNISKPSSSNIDNNSCTSSSLSLNTSAKKFGTTAHERMQSFHERKMQLINNARKRYIEKHNLDVSKC